MGAEMKALDPSMKRPRNSEGQRLGAASLSAVSRASLRS